VILTEKRQLRVGSMEWLPARELDSSQQLAIDVLDIDWPGGEITRVARLRKHRPKL
jgi:hypothetical protein